MESSWSVLIYSLKPSARPPVKITDDIDFAGGSTG
jgi:hypothetical protein